MAMQTERRKKKKKETEKQIMKDSSLGRSIYNTDNPTRQKHYTQDPPSVSLSLRSPVTETRNTKA